MDDTTVISVLMIEDDSVNAQIVLSTIEKLGRGGFAVTHAETLREGLERLERQSFDIVLLDLSLPDSSGIATIQSVLKVPRAVPVVVMTISDDEVLALQAMRAGVEDYLLKSRDIGPYLPRAIRHAIERFRIKRQLQFQNQRFRDFAEVAADWFWESGANHTFTFLSPRTVDIFGFDAVNLLGNTVLAMFDPSAEADRGAACLELLEEHREFRDFIFRCRFSGHLRIVKISGRPVFDATGRFAGYRGVGTDVTDQVEAESVASRALAHLSDALGSLASGGFGLFDEADRLVIIGDRIADVFCRSADLFVPGKPYRDIIRGAGERGEFAGARDRIEEWLSGFDQLRAAGTGRYSLALTGGGGIEIFERRTPSNGIIRIFGVG